MNLERKATLTPKSITLRTEEDGHRMSILYKVKDEFTGIGAGEMWLNFTPTQELIDILQKEVSKALNREDKNGRT